MNAIELMMSEHKNIIRMLHVVRKYSYKVLKNEEVDINDFYKIIDFIRNYADKHHHMKEENSLFNRLSEKMGGATQSGPIMGMLMEHDLGRMHIKLLEEALEELKEGNDEAKLDVIANAIAYAELLKRHIEKEDTVIYKYAERALSSEEQKAVEEECINVEKTAEESKTQQKYIDLLEELEKKVQ
ncbi:hemerythrin domain-containing protein [Clostridium sp. HMP27]|uniref:hemerythrin domain-containing protein n=1 Tax=Clostridium sp. HMP27 TaxID=1487921 RepID=UPI00052BA9AA|nr:hemerythrin domain-containing protein [Clostridium sp. HMP27]KGK86016.1 hemerythrin [Clostridium sp. HMP27]